MASPRKPDWLLFILTLQGDQKTVRMRFWRALRGLGAAVLRDGVYLLPNQDDLRARIEEMNEQVARDSGTTQILEIDARDEAQKQQFQDMFDRTPEYQALTRESEKLRTGVKPGKAAALAPKVAKLQRELDAIGAYDYFPSEASRQTRLVLEELAIEVMRASSPDEPRPASGKIERRKIADYRGRTWATRARPWADRVASAWLIRRFIDPRAKFVWLAKPKDCPKRAVGFDFDGAEFTHLDGKVTFEVLVASFGLESDTGLRRIGALIHFLDVGGLPVPEAAGFAALLGGAQEVLTTDDQLLNESGKLLEMLYAFYSTNS
ncbi:MAG TPA: chromate resistance protein ChrB domain-containing protein [Burkholderiales bacterium]|nr:chromate resistance protein ChrB domain-containing protein [Burkholderiales bacterium]